MAQAWRDAGVTSPRVQAVSDVMEAFRRRDVPALNQLLDVETFEFRSAIRAAFAGGGVYRGPGSVERYIGDLDGVFEDWHTEDEHYVDAPPDQVVLTYRIVGQGRQSELRLGQDIAIVWTFAGGRLRRGDVYLQREEAYAAVPGYPVHAMNDAIARKHIDDFVASVHPDVVWEHNIGTGSPEEGVYEGRERLRQLMARILEGWDYMWPEADAVREVEAGRYHLRGRLRMKHSDSDRLIVTPFEQHIELRGDQMIRGRMTTGSLVGG